MLVLKDAFTDAQDEGTIALDQHREGVFVPLLDVALQQSAVRQRIVRARGHAADSILSGLRNLACRHEPGSPGLRNSHL